MVLILDGNSEKKLPTCEGKQVFYENNFRYVIAANFNIGKIDLPISLYRCAPIAELPSNIGTMSSLDNVCRFYSKECRESPI